MAKLLSLRGVARPTGAPILPQRAAAQRAGYASLSRSPRVFGFRHKAAAIVHCMECESRDVALAVESLVSPTNDGGGGGALCYSSPRKAGSIMELDVESHLSAVHRSVAFPERNGQPASAVRLSRGFAATREDVWDAVTNGDRIPRWFAPVSGDLVLGGHYQIEGNAGGTITACERLSLFDLTWEFAGDVSWVEVRLSADGDGEARLSLTHTAILSPHWDTFGPGAVGVGWELGLLGLALHIADPAAPKPDEEAFAASPGRQGVHHRQQRGVGASRNRGRSGPRRRASLGSAHDRLLHRRISHG